MRLESNFQKIHPALGLVYYLLVLSLIIIVKHPIELAILYIALIFEYLFLAELKGENDKSKVIRQIFMPFFIALISGLLNALFRHYGRLEIFQLDNGYKMTWDSLIDGAQGGFRFALSILALKQMYDNLDSNKILYLFKPIFPSFSLLLNLIFTFFPRLLREGKDLITVNKLSLADKDLNKKAKWQNRADIIAKLSSFSLENSIETADSMQARGYGLKSEKTSYKLYHWSRKDTFLLVILLLASIVYFYLRSQGALDFRFYPIISTFTLENINFLSLISLSLIFFMPILTE